VHTIYKAYDDPCLARLFNSIRHPSIDWMEAAGGLRKSLTILKKHEILTTAVDINYFEGGIPVPSLGIIKTFPAGPAALSVRTGAPVITACMLLEQNTNKYYSMVDEPIYPDTAAEPEGEIRRITAQIAANLEHQIRSHPEQWFIFQKYSA
jgi:KDO2-lipid IV(A) lauroyltransferase